MSLSSELIARLVDLFDFNPISNRNLVVDPAKEVWSTATATALITTAAYGPNIMYLNGCGTGGAGTYTQASFSSSPSSRLGVPRPCRFQGVTAITTPSTGTLAARTTPRLGIRIEDYRLLEGASVTLSVYLASPAPLNIQQASIVQSFGSGGSPTASVVVLYPLNWNILVPFQRYSVRLDIPAAPGVTEGTTPNTSYTLIGLDLPPGLTYQLNDAMWQVEFCSPQASSSITGNGGQPTAFEYRGQQAELARVQRFWETGFLFMQSPAAAACGRTIDYKATKRVAPTIGFQNTAYSSASTLQVVAAPNTVDISAFGANFLPSAAAGYVTSNWTADARL